MKGRLTAANSIQEFALMKLGRSSAELHPLPQTAKRARTRRPPWGGRALLRGGGRVSPAAGHAALGRSDVWWDLGLFEGGPCVPAIMCRPATAAADH